MTFAPPSPYARLAGPVLATAAIALPTLIAYNLPPSATFFNQAAATIGWGGWLLWLASSLSKAEAFNFTGPRGLRALLFVFAITCVAALVSPLWTDQPWALARSNAGMILAAALTAFVAAAVQQADLGRPAFRAFCIGLLIAGAASSAVGIVQVYAPDWADGAFIATGSIPGTAVGNMRQPNHLSSLLLWSIVAAMWLGETGRLRRSASTLAAAVFLFVVVLTASRTGAIGALLLALWGVVDRRLSRFTRTLLWLAPVAYGLFWLANTEWAHYTAHVFRGEGRFSGSGDISSSRFGIWSNTLSLIRMHPWFGVGWGELNFAWSLTPFPGRPVAFFDHTHNLVLQFAVEMGIPLATLTLALLLFALWCGWRDAAAAATHPDAETTSMQRAALVIVLMIGLHSLLEYPLWYAYFLLPAAFAFGLCVGRPDRAASSASAKPSSSPRAGLALPLVWGAALLIACGALSLVDYRRVVVIFAPPDGAPSLAARIADGQRSWFFSHHANYAAATTATPSAQALPAFAGATHYLLDTRLMMAWAQALHAAGQEQKARYVAQRLKEFRNEGSEEFFEDCGDEAAAATGADGPSPPPAPGGERGEAGLPFQCLAPTAPLSYEDFRR